MPRRHPSWVQTQPRPWTGADTLERAMSAKAGAGGHAAARMRRHVRIHESSSEDDASMPQLVSRSNSNASDMNPSVFHRGRVVHRGYYHGTAPPRAAPKGKSFARNSIRVRWGSHWGTLHRGAWDIIDLDHLTPKMRLRVAFFKVVHLVRLRKMWSQIGALLQIAGRRTYFLRARELVWTIVASCIPFRCRRFRNMQNGGTPWTLQQA